MNKYYAVKVGRLTGIFNTWKECEQQVRGFSGSKYKSFKTNHEATNWLKEIPNEVLHTQIVNTEISYTEVWTDGSALNNSRSSEYSLAGIGVFFGDDHPNNKSLPLPGVFQTNQRAEIYAVIVALEVIGSNTPVIVYTDSKYVIDAMTDWIIKWRKNNFRTVTNKDLFQRLDKLINACTIKPIFKHVDAHSGIYGNEQADNLAKSGAIRQCIT